MKRVVFLVLGALLLPSLSQAVGPLIISEFMANNNTSINDDFGNKEDWIEIQNISATNVNLAGWYLTDTTNNLREWQFPSTNLAPNSYMIVFASSRDRRAPGAALHTNFKLSTDGEYLALVMPDGTNVATEFREKFPPQAADVSYGFATDARDVVLVPTNAPARALVPSADMGLLWTELGFNDTSWSQGTLAVGFDNNTASVDYNPLIGLNVVSMFNVNQTVYARTYFVLTNVTEIDTLTMTMLYDDGYVAFLNGHEIARDNAPDPLVYNSGAPANRADGTAITPLDVNVTVAKAFLQIGTNVLAFQALNNGIGSSDLLLGPKLVARTFPSGNLAQKYFPLPTPGTNNNNGVDVLGPLITEEHHSPAMPQTNEAITVTARVRPSFSPVASVKLRYRVMYNAEVEISMLDDGTHGDGLANDGVFGATIPASIATPDQMIRWYVRATDTVGTLSRLPIFNDPTHSPEYFGTIVPIDQTNNLEILHWFVQNPSAANTTAGTRASLFFLGEFYDNVGMNLHGQSSSGFPKKSYDVDFHRGYNFRWAVGESRVDDINLLTIYPDKAHMRNGLAYEIWRDAGTPYHFVRPVRVQQNGVFFSDAHLVENGDENYLERLGMDIQGALYKMYNTLNAATGEKKTRKNEDTSDLQALINGCLLSGAARTAYLFDNINLPEVTSYLAAQTISGNVDCCHKNYYLYRDTEGTREWQLLPWDVDLSFGRVWSSATTYWDDVLHPDTAVSVGGNNTLIAAIYSTPQLNEMFLRRVRTLMEELMQPPGTPASQGHFEQRMDYFAGLIAPDAALDLAKWGTWCCSGAGPYTQATIPQQTSWQTLSNAVAYMKTNYLPARRSFLFSQSQIPATQPSNAVIYISGFDYSPASSNQAQEYIELRNTNTYSVDMTGWKLSGGVDFTFKPGTVMPANSFLYVSPDVNSFRARTTGPRGGQSLYVVGPYQGQLSARGETLALADRTGRITSTNGYPGTPSLVQQYLRITEVMYHPAPLNGNTNSPEEFEYIELKNIGPASLSLAGVRFTNGIVFNFTGSAVTTLGAGQTVLVVKNISTFTARYGGGFNIAGSYEGYLDNAGERLQLLDAVGEEILDFSYNNSWYPITDGLGFSLVVVNENAAPDDWNSKTNWRASSGAVGSPGQVDPPPTVFQPVLINEALTRTTGQPDAIELYNPATNSAVDISGWFLTDDFLTPKKYRIPNGTTMQPGTYRVYTESNFNAFPGLPSNFGLSSDGDEVYLFSADMAGNLTGYYHGYDFGAAEENVSFGRHISSDGREHFVLQSAVTLNASNAGPRVGPIIISEIMYHPAGAGTNEDTTNEFVEILNTSSNTVPLYDPLHPTNTWKLTGGADFALPQNVSLAPGEALLIVNFAATNPVAADAFRDFYGVSPSVQLFGPYGGALDNDSDDIKLREPTPPLTNGVIPYAIVDRVEYAVEFPWPDKAGGLGFSLQRWNSFGFGNDPTNWIAAKLSIGTATPTNGTPPSIANDPADDNVIAGETATLTATVNGTEPINYQWRQNGANLAGATNLSLVFTNVQATNAGVYELVAFSPFGVAISQPATLVVRVPIEITQQPVSIDVRIQPDLAAAPTTNATFSVAASSIAPIQYQWLRDGANIPDATNSTYTVVDVKTNDFAMFSVIVSDDVSSAQSTNVWLYPWISPIFFDTPITQAVAANTPVTLSVSYLAWPPPFTLEWRLGNTVITSASNQPMFGFFTFTAPASGSVSYRAVVKNRVVPAGRATGFAVVSALADTDGDGIPDQWESRYGFNTNNVSDGLLDNDGDGMLNWQEYVAGTDPTNAASNLKLTSVISLGGVDMQFQAMSNKTYSIQVSSELGTNWQSLRQVLAGRTNTVQTSHDTLTPSNRFYRVVTPAQ